MYIEGGVAPKRICNVPELEARPLIGLSNSRHQPVFSSGHESAMFGRNKTEESLRDTLSCLQSSVSYAKEAKLMHNVK